MNFEIVYLMLNSNYYHHMVLVFFTIITLSLGFRLITSFCFYCSTFVDFTYCIQVRILLYIGIHIVLDPHVAVHGH